ncbi:copper homeostasis membrane protein CopD [Bradyrhizobium sp. Tv2a-2]|uniref:copper homeostasis membrane protein CopD n=1 Tax=Bradyrhizobium sp. Tv2a-2 TaxID=113395 RepID=UPI0003FC2390|nr:copper homeostasis membrane protein CopD [Bradyrhizobium sp. Tv2a-2]
MSFFAAEIDGPLVLTRAIHFAASATVAGVLTFRGLVAQPALRPSPEGYAIVQARLVGLTWAGLAVAVATGILWLTLETMMLAGVAFGEAIRSGAMLVVVNETQFGLVSEIRGGLAVVLAACLMLDRFALARWVGLAAGLSLVAAIAWTGHAGATLGGLGDLHLAADGLHLLAASAWIGGLAGLSVLFAVGRRRPAPGWGPLQFDAVGRFSILGIVSVAALIASGAVNTWILVGSVRALLVTDYGRLLLVKFAAFIIMVSLAAVNRVSLTPRLVAGVKSGAEPNALAALKRNTLVEIALGLAIFAIVGVLGTLHPAIHLVE